MARLLRCTKRMTVGNCSLYSSTCVGIITTPRSFCPTFCQELNDRPGFCNSARRGGCGLTIVHGFIRGSCEVVQPTLGHQKWR